MGPEYKDPFTGMEFVFVKGGCFQMGETAPDNPGKEICVDDFYIGKYEVTQGQWRAVMGNNPSFFKDCGDNCPVEQVSSIDAQEFVNKLNRKSQMKSDLRSGLVMFRLPYEAEWEYAARDGQKGERWAGTSNKDTIGDYAWFVANSEKKTHPVGQKKPNGLGIYDMSGNVWEWVRNGYEDASKKSVDEGTSLHINGGVGAIRGGSWGDGALDLRAANPGWVEPSLRTSHVGFRLFAMPVIIRADFQR